LHSQIERGRKKEAESAGFHSRARSLKFWSRMKGEVLYFESIEPGLATTLFTSRVDRTFFEWMIIDSGPAT